MQLSVVIPVHNEQDNIGPLLQEIHDALAYRCHFEVVVIDDGSTDQTPDRLNELRSQFDSLRVIRHSRSCGQSTALMTASGQPQRRSLPRWMATARMIRQTFRGCFNC